MQISYLLLFSWIIILMLGVRTSANHIFKSGISCLLALVLTFLYVYLEKSFANLNSMAGMIAYFEKMYAPLFASLSIPADKAYLIAQGSYLLIIFILLDILFFVLLSINVFGRSPDKKSRFNFLNIVFLIIYLSSWGMFLSVFVVNIAPILLIPEGFLAPLFEWIRGVIN